MLKGRASLLMRGPFLFAVLLTGCRDGNVPTAEESDQLNNAAQMLDEAPSDLANVGNGAEGVPVNDGEARH